MENPNNTSRIIRRIIAQRHKGENPSGKAIVFVINSTKTYVIAKFLDAYVLREYTENTSDSVFFIKDKDYSEWSLLNINVEIPAKSIIRIKFDDVEDYIELKPSNNSYTGCIGCSPVYDIAEIHAGGYSMQTT